MTLFDSLLIADRDDMEQKLPGVYPAKVTNNTDPEGRGRVKLTFPWLNCQDESDWARVSTLCAGEGFGSYFIPDVDSEVIVAFVQGDITKPIVIGALWHSAAAPVKEAVTQKNTIREIRTKGGHRLIFDDGETSRIEIATEKGSKILIDEQEGSVRIVDATNKNELCMDAQGIHVKAQMKVIIEGNEIELKANTALKLSGSAHTELSSGGITEIKGTMIHLN